MIYSTKNKKLLASEGAKATIGEEEFTLEFIDRTRDHPSGDKVLWQAISMMKEPGDWTNLPRLLHGLNNADALKFNTKNEWKKEKLVRKIGKAGRQDILLECIRQSTQTGLTLKDGVFIAEVLRWFQAKARDSEYEAEATSKSLKWAKLVATMMEDPSHTGLKNSTGSAWNVSEVPGILLGLAAVRASKHLGGEDRDGDVALYAQKLVQSLSKDSELNGEQSTGWTLTDVPEAYSKWLRMHVPILYGMKQAVTVLDSTSDLAKQLERGANDLDAIIRKYAKDTKSREGADAVWLRDYRELFPDRPIN